MLLGKQYPYAKEVGPLPYAIYKSNSKWIKDLSLRAKTIKLLEENIGVNLLKLWLGSGFLTMKPQATKEKNR